MSNGMLPDYVSMAKPNPAGNRAPWYKNTAPTYAGIFLWFVFWSQAPSGGGSEAPGGVLGQGVGVALLGLVVAALLCHFLFYLVPGLLGMKTGLPLYVVGTSTYGTMGGFLMPGFMMGVLQFGWLGVNSYFASQALAPLFGGSAAAAKIIAVIWAIVAAFVGLKGIQYVAKVATFLPLIPLAILIIMLVKTLGGIGDFNTDALITAGTVEGGATGGLSFFGVMALSISFVVGFFATAGAAGVDFGMNNKDGKDVQMGGLIGIALATIVSAGAAIIIAAGAFGATGKYTMNPADAGFMGELMGSARAGNIMSLLLAVAAFPPACFSSFIAANSFKTTLPKVNPFISVGIGTAVSIILAVTGWAGKAGAVFTVIGASFGPICGAMMVDYLLAGKKWAGPRAGWNLAGWISWGIGFIVGIAPLVGLADIPAAPLVAFVVGAAIYFVLAKAGLEPRVVEMTSAPSASASMESPV
ncbi:MAG: cytosine permease [Sedimentisphaerales bacterium]|nr:cytosine permease [Sedimentisphaerales bacterium]